MKLKYGEKIDYNKLGNINNFSYLCIVIKYKIMILENEILKSVEPEKTLTDEECDALLAEIHSIANECDKYCYGLPMGIKEYDDEM